MSDRVEVCFRCRFLGTSTIKYCYRYPEIVPVDEYHWCGEFVDRKTYEHKMAQKGMLRNPKEKRKAI